MRKTLKNNKGITLITLVITIIVLLILAGVAIATLTGNSSIIENSNKAAQAYNETASEDDALLGKLENKLKEYYMTGFNLANKVKSYSDCLIVIGIGGSSLGSMAVNEALKKYFDTTSFVVPAVIPT